VSNVEVLANVLMVASVVCATFNRIWTWPIGIVGCLCYAVLFFDARLYADVTLQFFFILTSVIGWRNWYRGNIEHDGLPGRLTKWHLAGAVLTAFVMAIIYGSLLRHFTDASLPVWDSGVLTFSIIAQILLMKRIFETWYFWIVVNCLAIPLFFVKELYLTSAVYTGFLINAFFGLYLWRKLIRTTNT